MNNQEKQPKVIIDPELGEIDITDEEAVGKAIDEVEESLG